MSPVRNKHENRALKISRLENIQTEDSLNFSKTICLYPTGEITVPCLQLCHKIMVLGLNR